MRLWVIVVVLTWAVLSPPWSSPTNAKKCLKDKKGSEPGVRYKRQVPPGTEDNQGPNYTEKPRDSEWCASTERTVKARFMQWLLLGCWKEGLESGQCSNINYKTGHVEYSSYDGWYNNLAHPELGAVDTPLLRRTPANYSDGVYQPFPVANDLPNPLTLSEVFMKGDIGSRSRTGKTALLVFFGQQVVEEILDAQRPACPPEYFNIPIPENHPYRNETGHTELPFLRTRYDMRTGLSPGNPRQQLNEITPWLDGGLTYGTSKAWADQLRRFENGSLAEDGQLAWATKHGYNSFPEYNTHRLPMANPPPPARHDLWVKRGETARINRFFKLGNPRGNENPFLLTFGVVWFRWHNVVARSLKELYPTMEWSGERLFNEARKWVIACHQRIVIYEWLPSWLGVHLEPYKGYNPALDPQIDQFFQSAAMRFGHTLVVPGVYLRDYVRNGCRLLKKENVVRTCNFFWLPQDPMLRKAKENSEELVDIDRLLMGMASQLSEAEDHTIVEDLRGRVFGPLEFSRRDLMAINLQRGRDHGLPDFHTARKAYGLEPVTNVSHFVHASEETKQALVKLYGDKLERLDVWVGGLLETGDSPGPLFTAIIKDQFTRIRDADRFWFENLSNGLFTAEEVARINQTNLRDIMMSVTNMESVDMQENPFQSPQTVSDSCALFFNEDVCYYMDGRPNVTCRFLPPLDKSRVEECTAPKTYDYFRGSELSFVLTFLMLFTIILGAVMLLFLMKMVKDNKQKKDALLLSNRVTRSMKNDSKHITFSTQEWLSKKEGYRPTVVLLREMQRTVEVRSPIGVVLRAMDLTHCGTVDMLICNDGLHLLLKVSNDYDLVLRFDSSFIREGFLQAFEEFVTRVGVARERVNIALNPMLRNTVTHLHRQKRLDIFFRVVFFQAFGIKHNEEESLSLNSHDAKEVLQTELTSTEFAEALSMRENSEFVRKMFALTDKDKNGFISFREFLDMLIIFAEGNADAKVKLMFDMYDINALGQITRDDFKQMLKSLMEIVQADVDQDNLESVVNSMMQAAGLSNQDVMRLEDFQNLLGEYRDKIGLAHLNFTGSNYTPAKASQATMAQQRISFIDVARNTVQSIYGNPSEIYRESEKKFERSNIDNEKNILPQNPEVKKGALFWHTWTRWVENNRAQIFWCALYTLVLLAIFAERAYYYSVEREHSGLRRIAGYGVTVTRGAASAMMFTYSSLLVTMCRNIITRLRETWLHLYVPFDSAIDFHKYIAAWALFFTVVHSVGHGFNFYHISTQTSNDLTCLFRNFFHSTHELPKFHYWCWQTITGVTGMMLVVVTTVIFVFALPFARAHLYNWFWFTHSLYPIFYILMVLHGCGRLVQEPFLFYFFLGPCLLYVLDTLVSINRTGVDIPVLRAELLPSDVTMLEFKRPNGFEYKSGQWVRIACRALNSGEFHPFTLSSSPNEKNLTLHIRAVGPWTTNIREKYDPSKVSENTLPKISLDGPYGESHQDWYQYEVSVMVGGGIGVTPFASILKDIVYRANKTQLHINCKKVYFFWVTKTQKQFEWLVDILRDVENADGKLVVSVHIFVTQFYQKFDLRTTLLYICERHFQRVCGVSLFTGLKAVTHFGRPNFLSIFQGLSITHRATRNIGVFSCGPVPMTKQVDQGCVDINSSIDEGPIFTHHYENF